VATSRECYGQKSPLIVRTCRPVIELSLRHIQLGANVTVDLIEAVSLAQRLLDSSKLCDEDDLSTDARSKLACDLLPACYDDWALVECERFHQLRLHALEALCERLTAAQRYGEAVDAGLSAVCAEPLRESAHRALIKAHIAEGNWAEARRQYELYRRILRDELGIEPTDSMGRLLLGIPVPAQAREHRQDRVLS